MITKLQKSFTSYAEREIKAIHNYSKHYNKLLKKNHMIALLKLANKHIKEIEQLYKNKDKHYIIEAGDLLILCFEIIKEAGCSVNTALAKCYRRYHKKLPNLIEELRNNKSCL